MVPSLVTRATCTAWPPEVVDAPLIYISIGESSILFKVHEQDENMATSFTGLFMFITLVKEEIATSYVVKMQNLASHLSQLFPLSTLLSLQLASTGKM